MLHRGRVPQPCGLRAARTAPVWTITASPRVHTGSEVSLSEAAVPLPPSEAGPDAGPVQAPRWQADAALVVAAFFFGTTFLVVQDAVERVDPLPFLAVRFLIGAAVLGAVARRRARPRRRRRGELRDGVVAGVLLLAGYVLQTIGLQYTTAPTSAFITYLLVVFVPFMSFALTRQRPHPLTLVGVVLAVAGLVLLTGGADTGFGRGEALTLGCAVAFAAHLVFLGEVAPRHDPVRLTTVQLATVGVACLVPAAAQGGIDVDVDGAALAAAAFTGIFATAVAFLAMVWAQRIVSPSRAALILLLEPVFAALLSALIDEPLTAAAVAGGGLILVAVLLAEVVAPTLTERTAGTVGD
jgi:drug/metabolite transporter (DMT)-like permease